MANRIDEYALLSVDEAADAVGASRDFDKRDALIGFINGVSDYVESEIGVKILSRSRTETFTGDGSSERFLADAWNVTALSDVVYNARGDKVPSGSKSVTVVGFVTLTNGYAFEPGAACSIAFTDGVATVPDDVKLAARMILKAWWMSDDKRTERIISVSADGQTTAFANDAIPAAAALILKRRKREMML